MNDEPHVLVVAASDSSGGAGISRDVATVTSFGLQCAVALTAITVQTHDAVRHVVSVEAELVADQMEAAFATNRIGAVKIGLVPANAAVAAIAASLRRHRDIPVVLDPVLAASSGKPLTGRETPEALVEELLPCSSLVTPNRDELARLSGKRVAADEDAVVAQGCVLLAARAGAVLAKGGHGGGETSTDYLLRPGVPPIPFSAPRLNVSVRGTGCMLASAIAAGLAQGRTLEESIRAAKQFVQSRLGLPSHPIP